MKKFIISILFAMTLSAATAQINKGTWMVGASSSFGINSYSFSSGSDATVISLNTKAGEFVGNNFLVGLNIGFTNINQSSSKATVTILGLFTRYYLPKNFFLGAGINSVTTSASSGSFSDSNNRRAFPFELGMANFITKNFAIEPSINYTVGEDKGGITINGTDIGAKSSLGLNIGLTFYPGRDNDQE